ncbi:MAG TPA: SRPBCC family protein [Pseudomonadales bacterium]|nr:SRPBCC family protein [Pseudomonadales bacterium]
MSNERFETEKVSLDYFVTAKYVFRSEITVRCTPQQLFASFEDPDSWPAWAMPITHVEWTSPKPFGVGTTRSVSMLGNLIGHEEFLAWEPYTHMAFRFNQVNQKNAIGAFAEDYFVTDLGNGTIKLVWTVAMEPIGPGAIFMKISRPLVGWGLQWTLNGLKKFMENEGQKYPKA